MKTVYRVLMVEDDHDVSNALREMIEQYSGDVVFQFDTVSSVAECTSRLASDSYSLILLDLNLSNGKGADTFYRIYAAANRDVGTKNEARTPIIVLTAACVDYAQIIRDGAKDFLHKPISARDLYEAMHKVILQWPWQKLCELQQEQKADLKSARQLLNIK